MGNSDSLVLIYQSKSDTCEYNVLYVRHVAVHFLLSSTAIQSETVTQVHGRTDHPRLACSRLPVKFLSIHFVCILAITIIHTPDTSLVR